MQWRYRPSNSNEGDATARHASRRPPLQSHNFLALAFTLQGFVIARRVLPQSALADPARDLLRRHLCHMQQCEQRHATARLQLTSKKAPHHGKTSSRSADLRQKPVSWDLRWDCELGHNNTLTMHVTIHDCSTTEQPVARQTNACAAKALEPADRIAFATSENVLTYAVLYRPTPV